MGNLGVVLAALDLESGDDRVLARAIQLATAHAARLTVLHVVESEPIPQMASHLHLGESELGTQLEQQALAAIAPLVDEGAPPPRMEVRVEFGSPSSVIVHTAHASRADLVVLGPGKGRTLKDKVLGSTADRVVRTSPAPILVARRTVAGPYRHIAIAVDGSAQSARAATEARRLAPEAGGQLVHAVEIPLSFQQAVLRAGTPPAEMERYRAARAAKAREEVSAFQRETAAATGLPVRILEGEPGHALVSFTKRARVDLLALGTHGRGAAMQALLGSVARRVLAGAACDVLAVAGQP